MFQYIKADLPEHLHKLLVLDGSVVVQVKVVDEPIQLLWRQRDPHAAQSVIEVLPIHGAIALPTKRRNEQY